MADIAEKKLDLARRIAEGMEELPRQRAYAIIALFSGNESDLRNANGVNPTNKVIYIRVLLALGKAAEAMEVVKGLSLNENSAERNRAEEEIALFLVSQGKIEEAKGRLFGHVSDPTCRANILQAIVNSQDDMISGLQRKLTLAESGAA